MRNEINCKITRGIKIQATAMREHHNIVVVSVIIGFDSSFVLKIWNANFT